MNILIFSASPREKGNCELLMDKIVDKFSSEDITFNKIYINNLSVSACISCANCKDGSVCMVKDDLPYFNDALKKADIVIVISPLYFCNIPAQFKAIVDRSQPDWIRKFVLKEIYKGKKRKGIFIMCASSNVKRYFDCSKSVVKSFFNVKDIDYYEDIFIDGVECKGDVLEKKDKLKEIDSIMDQIINDKCFKR